MEFLRYPHLIRQLFNGGRFGPPLPFTATSTWTWIGHPVSGLLHATIRAVHTRFPCGSGPSVLNLAAYNNSPDHSTKGTTSHLNVLCVLVNIWFQVLFHSAPAVLFTFPSRYYALSVAKEYFALEGGPPCFSQGSSCLAILWIPTSLVLFRLQGCHFLRPTFPRGSTKELLDYVGPQPRLAEAIRFGLFPVRSPLLGESRLITFPPGT